VTLGAVILAAGSGTRLGGVAKALLRSGDETYLARIARIARLAGTTRLVVVIGRPHDQQVGEVARAMGLEVVVNPLPERGMASSIALGFAAMSHHELDAAWLWPVDHPNVELRTLEALIAGLGTHEVAQPRFDGRGGHPPLVARALWPRLAACADVEGGARTVMATAAIARVPVDDGAVVRDIDTPADLAELG
jgi:CTP:molybdopterin cytidylyltransferase MocA